MTAIAILARYWPQILGGIVTLGLLGTIFAIDRNRDHWRDSYNTLRDEAATVLFATRRASDNPDVTWETTAGQIVALGEAHKSLKIAMTSQNARIDEMAREAVRLRAHADELRRIADRAQAQRKSALRQLSDMTITPGTREDCMTLLREAETALDIARDAGL